MYVSDQSRLKRIFSTFDGLLGHSTIGQHWSHKNIKLCEVSKQGTITIFWGPCLWVLNLHTNLGNIWGRGI